MLLPKEKQHFSFPVVQLEIITQCCLEIACLKLVFLLIAEQLK